MFLIKIKQNIDRIFEIEITSDEFQTESELQAYIECHPNFLTDISTNIDHLKIEEIKDYSFTIETK